MESPQGGRAREFTSSNDMAFGPAESFNMQLLMAGMLRSTCPGNDELWNALCVNSRYCQHSFTPPFIQERVMATRSGENQLMPSCILQRSRSPNSSRFGWSLFVFLLSGFWLAPTSFLLPPPFCTRAAKILPSERQTVCGQSCRYIL